MHQRFHICFCFSRLLQTGTQGRLLEGECRYKIELFKGEKFIQKTTLFQSSSDSYKELGIASNCIEILLDEKDQRSNQMGELRLVKRDNNFQQQLIGCYQFSFATHTTAYSQFHRKSIDLDIQIAQNLRIQYQVLVQNSSQGLSILKNQHLNAKKLVLKSEVNSANLDLLPEEFTTKIKRISSKEIKLGGESMTYKTRFWSPEKEFGRKCNSSCYESVFKYRNISTGFSKHQSMGANPSTVLNLNKIECLSASALSEFKNKNVSTMDEFDFETNPEIPQENEQLYKVIKNTSRITVPPEGKDYWRYKQTKVVTDQENLTNTLKSPQDPPKAFSIKLLLFIALVLLIGFGLGSLSKQLREDKIMTKIIF